MDRDSYEEPWELLGVIDSRRNPASWDRSEEWTFARNFPAQYYSEMNSILERAIAITGDDPVVLRSLHSDAYMLDTKIEYPTDPKKQLTYSYALAFSKLTGHEQFQSLNLDWRKYFAAQAIDRLSFSLFMYVYQPIEQLEPVVEIDGEFELIDPVMAEIHCGISSASEFIVLAEIWPVIEGLQDHLDREVQRKITQLRKTYGSKGGINKQAPIAELKEKFYNYYLENTKFSYAKAARRFLDELPQDEDPLLTPTNAVRTLTDFLGRRIKQDNKN